MSEESDAIIVVVSEETGSISFVRKGAILRRLTASELRENLQKYLIEKDDRRKNNIFDKYTIKARKKLRRKFRKKK